MKWIKYITSIVILLVAAAMSLSGVVSMLENIAELNIVEIIAGILTVAIGLYVGRIGLRLFRQEKFKFW